jgi:hypothetical protein
VGFLAARIFRAKHQGMAIITHLRVDIILDEAQRDSTLLLAVNEDFGKLLTSFHKMWGRDPDNSPQFSYQKQWKITH